MTLTRSVLRCSGERCRRLPNQSGSCRGRSLGVSVVEFVSVKTGLVVPGKRSAGKPRSHKRNHRLRSNLSLDQLWAQVSGKGTALPKHRWIGDRHPWISRFMATLVPVVRRKRQAPNVLRVC